MILANTAVKRKAVFLDRDGTIIHHIPYLSNPDQLRLLPNTADSLKKIRNAGFLVILVTNQSGITRGYLTEERLQLIHERLNNLLEEGKARLDAIFYCQHHPDDNCYCRKPKPGMLLMAAEEYNIDLKKSYIIGDDPKDVEAGSLAGCNTVLISKDANLLLPVSPSFLAERLSSATEWLLAHAKSSLQELQEREGVSPTGIR